MKKRFTILNITILFIFVSLLIAGKYYLNLRDEVIGVSAQKKLDEIERESLQKIANIKLSVFSIQANELNQVRNDIMEKFHESDFESIIIQPKAAFIDSLLYDSKLKEYMNNSNLKRSNQSLLNKIKLYLPNELLISFLTNSESLKQVYSIEEYLLENEYNYIGGNSIPTVKSNVKHYYYDKNLFNDVVTELSKITDKKNIIARKINEQQIFEFSFLIILFFIVTFLIQLVDYYLLNINMGKIKFLLKGHLNPRKYKKHVLISKSISLVLILIFCLLNLIIDLSAKINFEIDQEVTIFAGLIAITNLLVFIFKKERIEL